MSLSQSQVLERLPAGSVLSCDDCGSLGLDPLLSHDLLHHLINLGRLLLSRLNAIFSGRSERLLALLSIIRLCCGLLVLVDAVVHLKCRFVYLLEHLKLIPDFIVHGAWVLLQGLPLGLHLLEQL